MKRQYNTDMFLFVTHPSHLSTLKYQFQRKCLSILYYISKLQTVISAFSLRLRDAPLMLICSIWRRWEAVALLGLVITLLPNDCYIRSTHKIMAQGGRPAAIAAQNWEKLWLPGLMNDWCYFMSAHFHLWYLRDKEKENCCKGSCFLFSFLNLFILFSVLR